MAGGPVSVVGDGDLVAVLEGEGGEEAEEEGEQDGGGGGVHGSCATRGMGPGTM